MLKQNPILKQSIIYLLLSIIVVMFAEYVHLLIIYLVTLYTYVNVKLTPFFGNGAWSMMIRRVFSLVLLPVVLASIPALIYRLIKGSSMPYFIAVTWLIWLVIVLSKVLIH